MSSYSSILKSAPKLPLKKVEKKEDNIPIENSEPSNNTHIVTGMEMIDHFELKNGDEIMDLYYDIRDECQRDGYGLMQRLDNYSYSDFVELIVNNVNVSSFYKKDCGL